MAISWKFEIELIDEQSVKVKATRTDDSKPNPDPPFVVTREKADRKAFFSAEGKETPVLDSLWNKYQKKVADQKAIETMKTEIVALELSAKKNFEEREV